MEATRDNVNRFNLLFRERGAHEGAGGLFTARRQRQIMGGLLTEEGYQANYVLFRPSRVFARVLGDGVLRLNEALYGFRNEAADHVMFLEGDSLEVHYAELDRHIEKVRDRLVGLTAFCGKGFEGEFAEALESLAPSGPDGAELADAGSETLHHAAQPEGDAAAPAAKPRSQNVFEALSETAEEQGILTDLGRREGWVAFHPCPFYGRLVGEIVYALNDALRRVEGRTSYYIAGGNVEVVRRYYAALGQEMTALRGDLEGITAFCGRRAF